MTIRMGSSIQNGRFCPARRRLPCEVGSSAASVSFSLIPLRLRSAEAADRCRSATLPLFLDLGGLPAQIAQVVQLGAADVAAGDQLDPVQVRGMYREGPLDADAEADLANGEGLADAAALAADDVTGEDLDPGAGALDDLHMHLDRVT